MGAHNGAHFELRPLKASPNIPMSFRAGFWLNCAWLEKLKT